MKYIVIKQTLPGGFVREIPIIFPDCLVHADVADSIRLGGALPAVGKSEVVSAGFVSSMDVGRHLDCHGKSESLKIESRDSIDRDLINMIDYTHGLL